LHVVVLGVNHKAAPVEVREQVAFPPGHLAEALAEATRYVGEAVILSTCNRTEVYAVAPGREAGVENLRRFLCTYHDLPGERFLPYAYHYVDLDAVRHLFGVACGLDSMIVGEPQIQGQVRDAYEAAVASRAAGTVLGTLFRQALSVGKRARSETGISRNAASVSYAAVELARRIFGDLSCRQVFVVGAGQMGELTAKTLLDCGVKAVIVASRTRARAEELALRFGGEAIDFAHLPEGLETADIVVSSTAAPHFVIHADTVRRAMQNRGGRPLFLIDIAVPRDVDPEVQKIENVFLYDVDDLHSVVEANIRERRREVSKVESIIAAETAKFAAWLGTLEVVPAISALRSRAEGIRQGEIERAAGRLRHLSAQDWEVIDAMTAAIVNKLLHEPTQRLREYAAASSQDGRNYVALARDLFGLPENE